MVLSIIPTKYTTSPAAVTFMKSKENCAEWNDTEKVYMPYPDSGGISTIGWGHRLTHVDIASGIFQNGLSQHGCDLLFLQDLRPTEKYINSTGLAQNQGEFDAMVDFAFNAGWGNFALLRRLGISDPINWMHFIHDAKGAMLPGLVSRRQQDLAWFLGRSFAEVANTYRV